MKHSDRIVYGGVDTHLDVHVAAVIDQTGRLLATRDLKGYSHGRKSARVAHSSQPRSPARYSRTASTNATRSLVPW